MPELLAIMLALGAGPADPLRSSDEWSADHASHLLRRAGFGGTPEQINFLHKLGRRKAVEYLVHYEGRPDDPIPLRLEPYQPPPRMAHPDAGPEELQELQNQRRRTDRRQFERIVQWWIETMVSSPRPLQEKLVLFWHGHFTSGYREVQSSLALHRQNELFRRRASGNLRDLLIDITEDPAMILYLNTQQNRKQQPNENYARELLELFTLGPGHYTEMDIKEAARAFTGIAIEPQTGEVVYRTGQHDYGDKTFLGRTGEFDPADIIDIILKHPAAAEFIAWKFLVFFGEEDPDKKTVRALATVLRRNNYELKPMLTAMFASDAFYGERARFTHVKSPAELLIGTMRVLEIPPQDTTSLNGGLRQMGQNLMQPPNVKGWDGGAAWITTSTLFNRYNVMGGLLAGNDSPGARRQRMRQRERLLETLGGEAILEPEVEMRFQPPYDPMPAVATAKCASIDEVVDYFVQRLLQRPLRPERRQLLIDALNEQTADRAVQSPANAAAIRGMIHLILSMPEYQLS